MLSVIILCLFFCSQIQSQSITFYPNDRKMLPFLKTLENVVSLLERIMIDRWKRLNVVTDYLEDCTKYHKKLLSDRKTYLKNPVNLFIVLHSLTKGLDSVQEVINKRLVFKRESSLPYPSVQDLELNVLFLTRLQRFYKLNVTQLAAGVMNTSYSDSGEPNVEHFSKLTSCDCYTVGKNMNKYSKHETSVAWFIEALNLYDRDKGLCDFDKKEICRSLIRGYKMLDDSKNVVKWAKALLSFSNDYGDIEMANIEIVYYNSKWYGEKNFEKNKPCKKERINVLNEIHSCVNGIETDHHLKQCRGEMQVSHQMTKRLQCFYWTGYHPFLRLAPIRTEQLYVKPDIFLHHNVITHAEINNITSIEEQELKDCMYHSDASCVNLTVLQCTQQLVPRNCLSLSLNSSAVSITQRIFDLTGLWGPSERLDVTYYSVGNSFLPHSDAKRATTYTACASNLKMDINVRDTKNGFEIVDGEGHSAGTTVFTGCLYRVQTMLFYLSDVKQGGATVFSPLGLTVFPKKGSALSWTTMYPPDYNDLTCHAACPVLLGRKWVGTKWNNFDGHELRRPCTDEFPNGLALRIPPPVPKDPFIC